LRLANRFLERVEHEGSRTVQAAGDIRTKLRKHDPARPNAGANLTLRIILLTQRLKL